MGRSFNGRGSTVTINGHEATRTRRAGSPHTKRKARQMQQAELRNTVLKMYLERVSQADIGAALNLTQGRVSQLIKAAWEERIPERTKTIEDARAVALAETDLYVAKWAKRAQTNPRAADVLLGYLARGDRIQGLYQTHTSLSLDARHSTPDESADDLSLLDDAELAQLEYLKLKMQRRLPPPEPAQEPVIADWVKAPAASAPAQFKDERIVAVVEDDSLSAQIQRLYAEGLDAHAIAERLGMTLSELLQAIAPKDRSQ